MKYCLTATAIFESELISLPLHLFLTDKEIQYVIEKVNEAVKIWN